MKTEDVNEEYICPKCEELRESCPNKTKTRKYCSSMCRMKQESLGGKKEFSLRSTDSYCEVEGCQNKAEIISNGKYICKSHRNDMFPQ